MKNRNKHKSGRRLFLRLFIRRKRIGWCALLLCGVSGCFLVSCDSKPSTATNGQTTYQIQPETMKKTLFFTGILQPLQTYTMASPIDAVINTMPYQFGQQIKINDIVFTLKSSTLQKQFNETLTDYLKAKEAYTVARAKFAGTQDLWASGLVSKNNYLSEKLGLNNARVSLMQANRKLTDMIDKTGDTKYKSFSSLSFAQFDKVRLALSMPHDRILLKAPGKGVLLYPPQSSDGKSKRLTVGSAVKSGQVLAMIGDLTGVRVEIDIPEVDIGKIQPGMQAIVRSVAYPDDELKGKLVTINAQASQDNQTSLPSFTAIIEVDKLTPKQQDWVKVGMSANIELTTQSSNQIMVPIAAVYLHQGQNHVCLKHADGRMTEKPVSSGTIIGDKVRINAGLNRGDTLVFGEEMPCR